MPNITLSVDEATYARARVLAAQRGTSVSRLVRDYLSRMEDEGAGQHAEWQALWQDLDAAGAEVGEQPTRARSYDDARFS